MIYFIENWDLRICNFILWGHKCTWATTLHPTASIVSGRSNLLNKFRSYRDLLSLCVQYQQAGIHRANAVGFITRGIIRWHLYDAVLSKCCSVIAPAFADHLTSVDPSAKCGTGVSLNRDIEDIDDFSVAGRPWHFRQGIGGIPSYLSKNPRRQTMILRIWNA